MISMNDDYAEFTVDGGIRKQNWFITTVVVLAIIVIFAVLYLLTGYIPDKVSILRTFIMIIYILFGIPALWKITSSRAVEYDYSYIENEIEISEVYNGANRKKVLTLHADHAKIIAPKGSQKLLGFEGKGIDKVLDYSSKAENAEASDDENDETVKYQPYVFLMERDGKNVEIILEGEPHFIELVKYRNKDIFYAE